MRDDIERQVIIITGFRGNLDKYFFLSGKMSGKIAEILGKSGNFLRGKK